VRLLIRGSISNKNDDNNKKLSNSRYCQKKEKSLESSVVLKDVMKMWSTGFDL
jgi:hypothetical protein